MNENVNVNEFCLIFDRKFHSYMMSNVWIILVSSQRHICAILSFFIEAFSFLTQQLWTLFPLPKRRHHLLSGNILKNRMKFFILFSFVSLQWFPHHQFQIVKHWTNHGNWTFDHRKGKTLSISRNLIISRSFVFRWVNFEKRRSECKNVSQHPKLYYTQPRKKLEPRKMWFDFRISRSAFTPPPFFNCSAMNVKICFLLPSCKSLFKK